MEAITHSEENELADFLEKLSNRLAKQNEYLKESCAANNSEIERMHLQKAELFADICNGGPPTSAVYVTQLITDNTSWLHVFEDGMTGISQKIQMYREEYNRWRKTVQLEMQAQLGTDKFTMMPFHDIEAEMNELQKQTAAHMEEIQLVIEEGKALCTTSESQFLEIQQEVNTLEPFKKEIRSKSETLMHTLCKLKRKYMPKDSHTTDSSFIGLESLRSEIAALDARTQQFMAD